MSKPSGEGKSTRRSASRALAASRAGLDRLLAAASEAVDTSDLPEVKATARRVKRLPSGRLDPGRDSLTRRLILEQLGARRMTRHQLWKAARAECPTLPESAVYEFLRGQRMIGIIYAEALMKAAGLVVTVDRTVSMAHPTF